ncbi:MAG TPA: hypothetical protein VE642_10365, partial [Pyrinomonadaceae bacterium]|nr:hypothetical protein [Pyrinomonadaceae bacterium]
GGQCDGRAASAVRDFLAGAPALDRDLKLKVLEASDGLERCVRVRAKYAGLTPADAPRAVIKSPAASSPGGGRHDREE